MMKTVLLILNRGRFPIFVALAILPLLLISCAKPEPTIPPPTTEAATVTEKFDYTPYNKLLQTHVDEQGMVNYKALQKNRTPLDTTIANMSALTQEIYTGWAKDDQLAFWINAYNAITLKEIINNYPIQKGGLVNRAFYPDNSIRQIPGVWKKNTTKVLGQDITLDAIEHQVLREQFSEPRIHFAIVCASISCPALRNKAFEAEQLEDQLDAQSRKFLANPGKFRIDTAKKEILLSPILDWFAEDFPDHYNRDNTITGRSKNDAAVLDFVRIHLDETQAAPLTDSTYKIKYLDYDWSLNEQK